MVNTLTDLWLTVRTASYRQAFLCSSDLSFLEEVSFIVILAKISENIAHVVEVVFFSKDSSQLWILSMFRA